MREPNMVRRREEKSEYKKGPEVRFVVYSKPELAEVRRLLRRLDLAPGRPYPKHSQIVLPLYGTERVQRLLSLVREVCNDRRPIPTRRGRRRPPPPDR